MDYLEIQCIFMRRFIKINDSQFKQRIIFLQKKRGGEREGKRKPLCWKIIQLASFCNIFNIIFVALLAAEETFLSLLFFKPSNSCENINK